MRLKPRKSKTARNAVNVTLNTKSHPHILERIDKAHQKMEQEIGIPLTKSQAIDLVLQTYLGEREPR